MKSEEGSFFPNRGCEWESSTKQLSTVRTLIYPPPAKKERGKSFPFLPAAGQCLLIVLVLLVVGVTKCYLLFGVN